ncbi:MAG: hypothetical protein IPN72_24825 [Saprospiraceae bacterium]|nr:hypothetical protein [Saprospiraceae bacterium]
MIHFDQFEEEQIDKNELSNIISIYEEDMIDSQLNDYLNVVNSIKTENHTSIELDSNNQVIRFFSKINSFRINAKVVQNSGFIIMKLEKLTLTNKGYQIIYLQ